MKSRLIIVLLACVFCNVVFAEQENVAVDENSQAISASDEQAPLLNLQQKSQPKPQLKSHKSDEKVLDKVSNDLSGKANSSQSKKPELLNQPQDITSSLLQVTLGLFVVLMVIAGAAWIARRFGKFNSAAQGNLRIVGGLQMGSRERIVLMQVGEQQLLIGVAPGRIQTLHVLDKPLDPDTSNTVTAPLGNNPLGRFGDILKKVQSR